MYTVIFMRGNEQVRKIETHDYKYAIACNRFWLEREREQTIVVLNEEGLVDILEEEEEHIYINPFFSPFD